MAATVSFSDDANTLSFTAAPGEVNDLRLDDPDDDGAITVRDPGADLTAGNGCTPQGARQAVCEGNAFIEIEVRLGDGNDEFTQTGIGVADRVRVFGEAGDDTLDGFEVGGSTLFSAEGGEGDDRLTGNEVTPNRLGGGPGADFLTGGGGGDRLNGGPDADALDGGGGEDTAQYRDRTDAIRIDLRVSGPQGAEGENDTFTSIEAADGGTGDDTFLGNAEDNAFTGGGGRDVMRGFGGGDFFRNPGGVVNCGPGTDDVDLNPSKRVLIRPGCESLDLGIAALALPIRRTDRALRGRFACSPPSGNGSCEDRVTVKRRGEVIARGSYEMSVAQSRRVRMAYTDDAQPISGNRLKRVRVRVDKYVFDTFV
jgi:hypothetical protein